MDMTSRLRKFRTKLCRNFVIGNCGYGDSCTFLHPPLVFPPFYPRSSRTRQYHPSRSDQLLQDMPPGFHQLSGIRSHEPPLVNEEPFRSIRPLSTSNIRPGFGVRPNSLRSSKKYPCRHFVRTGGWCPVGDGCKFIHDYSIINSHGDRAGDTTDLRDAYNEEGRIISGGVRVGIAAVPGHVNYANTDNRLSQHACKEDVKSFSTPVHTSGGYWPILPCIPYGGVRCATSTAPVLPLVTEIQQNSSPLLPSTDQSTQRLPVGAYEMHGTTYFPILPVQPLRHDQAVLAHDHGSYQAPEFYQPTNHFPGVPSFHREAAFHTYESPIEAGFSPLNQWVSKPEVGRDTHTDESEFPYRPPKNQRVGHARRITVTIRKLGGLGH